MDNYNILTNQNVKSYYITLTIVNNNNFDIKVCKKNIG